MAACHQTITNQFRQQGRRYLKEFGNNSFRKQPVPIWKSVLQTIFPVSEIIILPQNTRFLTRPELRFHIQIPKSNNRLSSTQNYVLRSQNMNSYSLAYCFSDFAIKGNIEVIYFFNLFNCRLRSIIKIWSIFCYVNFFVLIFISQLRLATKRFYKRCKRI